MSLEQYWNAFYDNEAPFFINKMTEEQGNELLNQSNWMDPKREEPDKDYLFGSWGYDTISYRTYDAKIFLDNNPIADHCISHV